jgi:hypothetical protein
MPAVTLNGVSFAGTVYDANTVRRAPQHVNPRPRKISTVLVGREGTRNQMLYGTKTDYELIWEQVAETTRAAVRAVFDLTSTFTAILPQGTVTVQCEGEDYKEDHVLTFPDGTRFFNVTLTLRQP